MRARLAGFDNDITRYHLDMLVAQGAQHSETGIKGDTQRAVALVALDVLADVRDVGDVFEKSPVRAGHVRAHFVDEVVARWRGLTFWF